MYIKIMTKFQTGRPNSFSRKSFRDTNSLHIACTSTTSTIVLCVLHTAQELSLCWLIVPQYVAIVIDSGLD
jgi:hypothetical protein